MPRYDDRYDRYDDRYDRYDDRYDRYNDRYDRYDRYGGNTKLYVGHLSTHTRTKDVEYLFGRYGRWGNWIWIYAFCAPLDLTSVLVQFGNHLLAQPGLLKFVHTS